MIRSSGVGAVLGVLACAAVVGAQALQPERLIMVGEAGKPAQKCRVLKCWKDKEGNKACQVQAIDSGEMMTIVETEARPAGGSGVVRLPAPPTKVVHWGGETTPPPLAPAAPADALVVGTPKPAAKPSMVDRMFASSRPRVSTQSKVTPVPAMNPDKPTVVAAAIEPPYGKPREWRDSWGTVERISDDDASKAAAKAKAKAEAAQPPSEKPEQQASGPASRRLAKPAPLERKPAPQQKPSAAPVAKQEKPASTEAVKELPKPVTSVIVDTPDVVKEGREAKPAQGKKPGRLPALLTEGPRVEARAETKKVDLPPRMEAIDTKPSAVRPALTAPRGPGSEASLWASMTGIRQQVSAAPPAPAAPAVVRPQVVKAPAVPTGAASWNAAAMTPPAPGTMPSAVSLPASARNAFTEMVPGAPAMQPMPMLADAGVPAGLNNAFTMGGSTRPIPSDMGRTSSVPNGLQGGGQMGGAENRPPFVPPPGYYVPVGYYPAPMVPVQMPPMPPSIPASVVQVSLTEESSGPAAPLQTLRDAVLPSEREMAVDQLRRCDWKRQPEVVEGLTKAAKSDPAATVRVACVRALARMKVNTVPVVAALTSLKTDRDVRVRQEVEQALAVLARP